MDIVAIKQAIKDSVFGDAMRIMARPYFWYVYKKTDLQVLLRKKGIIEYGRYKYLKKWKDIHHSEKCFIVATGPSLTYDDLDKLADSGVYSFGMNSCALCLDKTKWVPDLLGIQDEFVYAKIENVLLKEAEGKLKDKVWVADVIHKCCPSSRSFKSFALHYLDHKYNPKKTGEIKFSDDCYSVIYDDYSIIFSIMQLATYMGFKEMYLLGTDCNYNQAKQNFIDNGTKDPNRGILGNKLIYTHSLFRKFADAHGVKVFNCTRGGMLEEYPRKTLEEVLGNEKCEDV